MEEKKPETCLFLSDISLTPIEDPSWFKFSLFVKVCPEVGNKMTDDQKKEYVAKHIFRALKMFSELQLKEEDNGNVHTPVS
jgi:hypothetical protein